MSAFTLPASAEPHLRRLDHLICLVPDIRAAMRLFTEDLGFPLAWPIGRFWPQAQTSGVAIGGLNVEFIQPDVGAPEEATIRTLVFEPTDIEAARAYYLSKGLPIELREKWEPDSGLLRLRGYSAEDSSTPQLICRNLMPLEPTPVDFFLCEYSPFLHHRLSPGRFPEVWKTTEITVTGAMDPTRVADLFPLQTDASVAIRFQPDGGQLAEVQTIRTERGPLDTPGWPARFRFI